MLTLPYGLLVFFYNPDILSGLTDPPESLIERRHDLSAAGVLHGILLCPPPGEKIKPGIHPHGLTGSCHYFCSHPMVSDLLSGIRSPFPYGELDRGISCGCAAPNQDGHEQQ